MYSYSSFINQLLPILHYVFSFLLLFFLLPKWLFPSYYENKWENWFSRYARMVFLLIISGYILVITKLYEVLCLILMFSVLIAIRHIRRKREPASTPMPPLLNRLFDWLDGLLKTSRQSMKAGLWLKLRYFWKKVLLNWDWTVFSEGIALFVVLVYAAFIRFYDAFVNAAPPMSDSYVTLAWMKYINNRDLFHDGIYPQGFHIYLASLSKFAAVDALYILRYTGPLNTVMITAGLYIVIRKLTNNAVGALTAAWMYGILWVIIPLFSTDRQAATNSQEFAFVFIYPAIYFLVQYFRNERRQDLIVGLICTAITGLVHSLGYALLGLMIGILLFSAAVTLKKKLKLYVQTVAGGILTGGLSVLPLGAGYLLGKNLNSSSADYLVSQNSTYQFTPLTMVDYITLGSLLLLLLLQFRRKLSREERFIGIFTFLTGGSVFVLYYAGAVITHSTVIASRSIDLWGLTVPFCVGVSVSYLFNLPKADWMRYTHVLVMLGLMLVTVYEHPSAIIPYKLEYNENVEQYLRITENYLPQTWLIVSQDEGYDLALGKGFHLHLGDFLKTYDPKRKPLTKMGAAAPDPHIPPHVFIYQEKKVFKVSKTNSIYTMLAPEYKRRAKEYRELSKWIHGYKQSGNPVKVFYQNKHIIVYQIDISANVHP